MDKTYRKINFIPGSTIDEAVSLLTKYHAKGELVSGSFNGVTLCSDTVTTDSAYKEITGLTKTEYNRLYFSN